MTKRPALEQFNLLRTFLNNCEDAALPIPPQGPPAQALLGGLFARRRGRTALGGARESETLSEVLNFADPPFDAPERLGSTREERIAQLRKWLVRFTAFKWMNQQAYFGGSLQAFEGIAKSRKRDAKFNDDLAIFRFWDLALFSLEAQQIKYKPPPLSDERHEACEAAETLQRLATSTSLLGIVGFGHQQQKDFLAALNRVQGLRALKKVSRNDAFTSDRQYVKGLARYAIHIFGDASPKLICELVDPHVKNADITSITKLIGGVKKLYESQQRALLLGEALTK